MSILEKIAKNKAIRDSVFTKDESEVKDFISTGCLTLNLLFSGRLNGGIPVKKVSQIAAPSSLGKSFVGMKVAKNAQKKGMDVVILDTEFAYDFEFSDSVGVDAEGILVIQDNQIESCQQKIISMLTDLTQKEKDGMILIIDSWGGLVTSKAMNDAVDGKDVNDMTASKKKNSFARLLTGMGVTVFVVNQTYECGTENMMVMTPQGPASLKDLVVGDEVETTEGVQEISMKVDYDDAWISEVELADGTILEFTSEHKFQVERDGEVVWVPLNDLMPGESLINI